MYGVVNCHSGVNVWFSRIDNKEAVEANYKNVQSLAEQLTAAEATVSPAVTDTVAKWTATQEQLSKRGVALKEELESQKHRVPTYFFISLFHIRKMLTSKKGKLEGWLR